MSRQPGSPNPFKNGPYRAHITKAEAAGLSKTRLEDLDQEIGVLRVSIKRLVALGIEQEDVDAQTKLARGVALLINTLNNTLRTRDLLSGAVSPLDEALEAVLQAQPFYLEGPPPEIPEEPPEEPSGPEAEIWRQIFAVNPNRRSKRSRRRAEVRLPRS